MSRKTLSARAVVAAAAAVLGATALAVPAFGSSRPSVSLNFPNNRVSANQAFGAAYSSAHLPKGAVLDLQRQFGTAHVWKLIKKLPGKMGQVAPTTVGMGRYNYRVIVVLRRKTIAVSATRALYAYGPVALSSICKAPQVTGPFSCQPNTEQVGATVFDSALLTDANIYPAYTNALTGTKTTCRSMHLLFAQDDHFGSTTTYVQLVQSASDPQSASSPPDTVGVLNAHLDGGSWILDTALATGEGMFLNGSFDCYTPSGF